MWYTPGLYTERGSSGSGRGQTSQHRKLITNVNAAERESWGPLQSNQLLWYLMSVIVQVKDPSNESHTSTPSESDEQTTNP